jgi:hypothetical protein
MVLPAECAVFDIETMPTVLDEASSNSAIATAIKTFTDNLSPHAAKAILSLFRSPQIEYNCYKAIGRINALFKKHENTSWIVDPYILVAMHTYAALAKHSHHHGNSNFRAWANTLFDKTKIRYEGFFLCSDVKAELIGDADW